MYFPFSSEIYGRCCTFLIGFFVLNLRYHICKGFGMFEVVPSVFPPFFFVFKVSDYGLFFFVFPFFLIMC